MGSHGKKQAFREWGTQRVSVCVDDCFVSVYLTSSGSDSGRKLAYPSVPWHENTKTLKTKWTGQVVSLISLPVLFKKLVGETYELSHALKGVLSPDWIANTVVYLVLLWIDLHPKMSPLETPVSHSSFLPAILYLYPWHTPLTSPVGALSPITLISVN